MAGSFWYADADNQRKGPISRDETARLISRGEIRPDTLMWTDGFADWRRAAETSEFADMFIPRAPAAVQSEAGAKGRLVADLPALPLFGWLLLNGFGMILIVPYPWAAAGFYRWFFGRIRLPDGAALQFLGRGGELWPIFILWALLAWLEVAVHTARPIEALAVVVIPFLWATQLRALKWIVDRLSSQDGRVKLTFQGGYLAFIGWNVLLVLSVITIVGWAWVLKYMLSWMCRNARGTDAFEFVGSGLSILWRMLVVAVGSILIIPIPWLLAWQANWYVSQIEAL